MELLKYTIEDSTIAELLGVQNFTSPESAILELVKNAYDASALNFCLTIKNKQLIIVDDGIGMTAEDIRKYWMNIGKSEKKYKITDSNNEIRIQAGSKGIGRFALARLGKNVSVLSKKAGNTGIIWETDWNSSSLDNTDELKNTGTEIIINDLREKWTKPQIKKLIKYLERTCNCPCMTITLKTEEEEVVISNLFPIPQAGYNCRSIISLSVKNGQLITEIKSDEFLSEAKKYCPDINLESIRFKNNLSDELKNNKEIGLEDEELGDSINKLGSFSACLFFNLVSTREDKEKFLYKYLNTKESIPTGIVLYRNAFSIDSFDGKKDWLGLGKRSRKSPAAASHPTGSWRVRENQMAGYVTIDKKDNEVLQDLSNRQGLDENIYYTIFVQIILSGIKEFERYRQSIIRKINIKNKDIKKASTPVIDEILKNPNSIKNLNSKTTKELLNEIKQSQTENEHYKKDKEDVEKRYNYDVRILNMLATSGLKASSVAHELKNDRNTIVTNYDYIIEALKDYGYWESLCADSYSQKAYKNVPLLLDNAKKVNKKIVLFMDTMLEEIEKQRFEAKYQSVGDILKKIIDTWERDYAWININLLLSDDIVYHFSEDNLIVIFDNLILNSVQQNKNSQNLTINISAREQHGLLDFSYYDDGKGLDKKYHTNPFKILEVHETTRKDGHGLGMWIVNNTCNMCGGEVHSIRGSNGFFIGFTIGDKNNG